jgi:hypothetical protein
VVTHFRREEETVFPLLVEADGENRALLVQALLDTNGCTRSLPASQSSSTLTLLVRG